MNSVKVRVPATTANIGPGFDCLGCALSLYAHFTCEIIDSGLEITGCPEAFRNEENLFVQAYRLAERCMGVEPAPIRVHIETDVPVSRGLGSSATLLAGGVTAANALNGNPLSRQELVELCNEIEGHPDNVAPAVLGGMCASLVTDERIISAPAEVAPNVGFIAMIPDFETETRVMRAVLPKEVPFKDAVFNISHLAVLLHGFRTGDLEMIGEALDDRLHQPYRGKLIDNYYFAQQSAMDARCAAFCISGSGSTCLAVVDAERAEEAAEIIRRKLAFCRGNWRVLVLKVDTEGAVIVG